MSKPSRLFAVVALLAVVVACGVYLQRPAVAQEKKENPWGGGVKKWEYRIVSMREGGGKEAEKELNKLGEEGFEIAFVTGGQATSPLVANVKGGGGGESTPVFLYTLKRAK